MSDSQIPEHWNTTGLPNKDLLHKALRMLVAEVEEGLVSAATLELAKKALAVQEWPRGPRRLPNGRFPSNRGR